MNDYCYFSYQNTDFRFDKTYNRVPSLYSYFFYLDRDRLILALLLLQTPEREYGVTVPEK